MRIFYSIFIFITTLAICTLLKDPEEAKPSIFEMIQHLASEKGGQYTTFSNLLLQVPKLKNLLAGIEHFEGKGQKKELCDDEERYEMILFMPTNLAVANRGSLETSIFKNAILYHIVRTKLSRKYINEAAAKGHPIVLETALSGTNSHTENSLAVRLPLGIPQRLILNGPRSIPSELSDIVGLKADQWSVQYGLLPEANLLSSSGWECSNGLILPIDIFLLPPVDFVVTMASLHVASFIRLLSSAAMGHELPPGTLIGKPGVTLFLPIQEALMEKIEFLQQLSKQELDVLLKRHIVLGGDSPPIYLNGQSQKVKSASGETLYIEPSMDPDSEVGIVNGQKILYGNVLLSNGVAHIIDGILTPSTRFVQMDIDDDLKNGEDNKTLSIASNPNQSTDSSLPATWSGSSAFLFAGALLAVLFIL